MLWNTHLAAGLIVGKMTGQYDAADGANFYPFFPSRRIKVKGPIPYASVSEFVLSIGLFGLFFAL